MTKEKLDKAAKLLKWIGELERNRKLAKSILVELEESRDSPSLTLSQYCSMTITANCKLETQKAVLELIVEDLNMQLKEPLKDFEEL